MAARTLTEPLATPDLDEGLFVAPFVEGTLFPARGALWRRRLFGPGRDLRGAETLDRRYRVVEQNVRTASEWAQYARLGHRIAWVFDTQKAGSQYAFRLVDGTLSPV